MAGVRSKKKGMSIQQQKKALKKLVLNTPVEELLPNKNREAAEMLKRAGLDKN